jgi:hypothetical protein
VVITPWSDTRLTVESKTRLFVPAFLPSGRRSQTDPRLTAMEKEPVHYLVYGCPANTNSVGLLLMMYRVSLFYLVGLFDLWHGLRDLLISSVGAYAIAAYVHGPLMPWVGFVFLMGHMSVGHIVRQLVNEPSQIDITGIVA